MKLNYDVIGLIAEYDPVGLIPKLPESVLKNISICDANIKLKKINDNLKFTCPRYTNCTFILTSSYSTYKESGVKYCSGRYIDCSIYIKPMINLQKIYDIMAKVSKANLGISTLLLNVNYLYSFAKLIGFLGKIRCFPIKYLGAYHVPEINLNLKTLKIKNNEILSYTRSNKTFYLNRNDEIIIGNKTIYKRNKRYSGIVAYPSNSNNIKQITIFSYSPSGEKNTIMYKGKMKNGMLHDVNGVKNRPDGKNITLEILKIIWQKGKEPIIFMIMKMINTTQEKYTVYLVNLKKMI